MRVRPLIEKLLILTGLALCGLYALERIHSAVASRLLVSSFAAAAAQTPPAQNAVPDMPQERAADFAGWSQARIAGYKKALAAAMEPPLGVLSIPKIGLEVPVLEGIDTVTLDRGAGRIPGTAMPGQPGNIGIAGHRDGFFRGLKDISKGDTIIFSTLDCRNSYTVESIRIVNPGDVKVLGPTPSPSLTLVTCYPFYFIGAAPRRFVVHATLKETTGLNRTTSPNARTVN